MNKTIIFISGWKVPQWIAKSKLVWDNSMWHDYRILYLDSKTPTSNQMISKELDSLQDIMEANPSAALVGQSLGGWWAANLALRFSVNIRKLVFWTPVCNASVFPIFKAGSFYNPLNRQQTHNSGPHRVLTCSAHRDLIVPPDAHGYELAKHFNSMTYNLNGGHILQSNHKAALQYMKDWIEL